MWESSIFYSKNFYKTNNYFLKSSFINKLYHYYINKGYTNLILLQVYNIIITVFLILYTIFIYNCIDYNKLIHINSKTSIKEIIHPEMFFELPPILWLVLISLVLFIFVKIICIIDDILVFRNINYFYNKILSINDNDLQTIQWKDIIEIMKEKYGGNAKSFDIYYICNKITNKENYFIAMMDNNIFIIDHLTSLMEWNIIFCILNYLFNQESQINPNIFKNKEKYLLGIQKRIRVVSLLNFILMPFILTFIMLYNIFNYGETFYNNPQMLVTRNYTRNTYWRFKHYNELQHHYEARLFKSNENAAKYLNQFNHKLLDTFSRLIIFIISSIFVLFMGLSIINQNILINLYVDNNRNVLWYVGISVSVIAIFKNFVNNTSNSNPREWIEVLNKDINLPKEWIKNANSRKTYKEINYYFPYKIITIFSNIFYTLLTPFQLWSLSFDVEHILDFIIKSTVEEENLGHVCRYSLFNKYLVNSNFAKIKNSYDNFVRLYPDWKENNLSYDSEYSISYHKFPDLFR